MICTKCREYNLFLNLEEYIVANMPTDIEVIEDVFDSCIEIADKKLICNGCGNEIIEGESYIEDDEDFKDIIFRFIGQQVMNEIDSCQECGQGADIQGLYPSIKSCFYDEEDDPEAIFDSYDTASTIEDIMNNIFYESAEQWEPYYEHIVEYVECPVCNNGSGENYDDKIDYGKFDLYTEVYTHSDINLFNHDFYGDEFEEIKIEISDLARNFSLNELVNLKNEYVNNKTFIARNPIFYKLECFLKNLLEKKEYYILFPDRMIYRARTSNKDKLLTKDDMWEPPYNVASHGRYNDIGVSVLYCANNSDVIKKEVPISGDEMYNIAKFILHKPFYLFPINYVFRADYTGLVNEEVPIDKQNNIFKEQYILSNIVSAICLQVGYDGIVYRSTKDNFSIDYALFCKYKKDEDLNVLSVEIY